MDKISELMDGELDEQAAGLHWNRLKQDERLKDGWHRYHLIGDVMRGEAPLSPQFQARMAARLAAEPTVLAPRRRRPARRLATYALSAAASLSAVALVAWVAVSSQPIQPPVTLATVPAAAPAPAVAPQAQIASVPSDGRMNEYLIAHQEFSPSTAIQGLAPYIRGVASSQPSQGR